MAEEKGINKGMVYFVGAGPGDPGLITCKGLKTIRRSEVIVYDRLIARRLLQEAPENAELIYVGKSPEGHTLKQEEINHLLLEKALQGLTVTRLKGGDPFVFGRGGEEALLLAEHQVPFEIVPGVTSAVAVPAYAGIPVTHRGLSSSFTVVTGHEDPAKPKSDLDWPALARSKSTLVFLMGMGNLAKITERLLLEGLSADTPAAIIQQGAGAAQRTLVATAGIIAAEAERQGFSHPAIIVIGRTVLMRRQLQWFEQKPLFGRRIVVTRAREQASIFAEKLEALGAETIEIPAISIEKPLDYGPLDRALDQLSIYSWVIFTSENGVTSFFRRLRERGLDIRTMQKAAICAIGPQTAAALADKGLVVNYMPPDYRAEALVEQLKEKIKPEDRVLLPRADIARPLLEEELLKLGAVVDNVTAYRTVRGRGDAQLLKELLKSKEVDLITFTSSSTVRNLISLLLDDRYDGGAAAPAAGALKLLEGVSLAAIGPITAATIKEYGLEVAIEAAEYTIDGLITAITSHYSRRKDCE